MREFSIPDGRGFAAALRRKLPRGPAPGAGRNAMLESCCFLSGQPRFPWEITPCQHPPVCGRKGASDLSMLLPCQRWAMSLPLV